MTTWRKKRGKLQIDFYLPHGGKRIRIRESLRLIPNRDNEIIAKKIAAGIETEIAAGRIDLVAARFPGSRAMKRLGLLATPKAPAPSLEAAARSWLDEKRRRRSKGTVSYYEQMLDHLWTDEIAKIAVDEIGEAEAEAFIGRLSKREVPAGTVNRVRARCISIYRVQQRRLKLAINPFAMIEPLPIPEDDKRTIDPLDRDEANAVIAASQGWERALVTTAIGAGLREGELFALKWDCIEFGNGRIRVERSVGLHGEGSPKTIKSRRGVDMAAPVREVLMEQRARTQLSGGYVFPNQAGNFLAANNWNKRNWSRLLKLAGLRYRPFGQTRHTFATLLLSDPSVDLRYIADQMGHESLEMLFKHYAAWMPGRAPKPSRDVMATLLGGNSQGRKKAGKR